MTILLGAVSNAAEIPTEGRSLAAVMLRRLFSSEFEEFFGKVGVKTLPKVEVTIMFFIAAPGGTESSFKRADY